MVHHHDSYHDGSSCITMTQDRTFATKYAEVSLSCVKLHRNRATWKLQLLAQVPDDAEPLEASNMAIRWPGVAFFVSFCICAFRRLQGRPAYHLPPGGGRAAKPSGLDNAELQKHFVQLRVTIEASTFGWQDGSGEARENAEMLNCRRRRLESQCPNSGI